MTKAIGDIFPCPPADIDPARLDLARVPEHVAVIMDGNGRWAKQRGNNRLAGHKAGIHAVRETIRTANDVGVRFLTLYSFSSENWRRPADEVTGLMDLFAKTMLAEVDGLDAEHVRIKTIGDLGRLPEATREAFEDAIARTAYNDGMTLVLAVNYGAREEILRAVRRYVEEGAATPADCAGGAAGGAAGVVADVAADVAADAAREGVAATGVAAAARESACDATDCAGGATGAMANAGAAGLCEDTFRTYLDTAFMPDPDLLIRTSGEMRVSNFLLWQIAYTEFYCSEKLWPDFDRYEFLRALLDFQGRNRRFGAV